jgi:putative transposase
VQRCIVHQARNSCKFANYEGLKPFCADTRLVYTGPHTGPDEEAGLDMLARLEEKLGSKYLYAAKGWTANWPLLATFFKYPPESPKPIYTTSPIENLNRRVRRVTKTKGSFPTEDSPPKLLCLIVVDAQEKWMMATPNRGAIQTRLAVYFRERVETYL